MCGEEEMKLKDLDNFYKHYYKEKCKCGYTIEYYTQEDNSPEYYHPIYIICPYCNQLMYIAISIN